MRYELDKKELERIELLLMDLDIEIGSTINSCDNKKIVMNNMKNANCILCEIKKILSIKF